MGVCTPSAPRPSPTWAPRIGLLGAVPGRIPFFGTFAAQLAGSFVNRIIPARVGGIATNVRFLQKQGIDLAVASSSIGLQQLSGLLMHISPVVRLPGVGRAQAAPAPPTSCPRARRCWSGLTAILALSGLLFLLPVGRRVLRKRVIPIVRRAGQRDRRRGPPAAQAGSSSSVAPRP